MKNRKYYLILSLLSFFIFILFYLVPLEPSLPSVNNLPISKRVSYTIAPMSSYRIWEEVNLYLPSVRVRPNDRMYFLIQLRERLDLRFGNRDELFFAEKRIAELERWGDSLSIAQWKNIFDSYSELITKYKEKKLLGTSQKQKLDQIIFLYQKINAHESKLGEIIHNASLLTKTKTELSNYIYTTINALKFTLIQNDNNDSLAYSLDSIILDKEFGTYSVGSNESIEINPENKVGIYNLKNPFVTSNFVFSTAFESDNESTLNRYLFDSYAPLIPNTTYLAKISHSGKYPANIVLNQGISSTESAELINQTIYPYEKMAVKTILFTTPKSREPFVWWPNVVIESKHILSPTQLDSLNIEVRPAYYKELKLTKTASSINYEPQVTMNKIGHNQYQINYKNTTKKQEDFIKNSLGFMWKTRDELKNNATIYNSFTYYLIVVSGISLFIFIFFNFIKSLVSFILKVCLKVCQWLRYFVLLAALLMIFFDVFFILETSDSFILQATFLWIISLIGFGVEARVNFVFALIYLILCPVFVIFQKELQAEKAAIWVYVMMIIGTIHSIIEAKKTETKSMDIKQYFQELMIPISPFLDFQKKYYPLLKEKIFSFIKKFINFKPRTISDHFKNLFFITLFSVLIGLFLLSVVKVIKLVVAIQKENYLKEQRSSLNPYIETVEPTIVYPATKVIIYGAGFNDDNNFKGFRLVRNGSPVRIDYQDRNKIIFTIPLDWPKGKSNIWIEKEIEWQGKKIIQKTEPVTIKFLKVTNVMGPDDNLYFEQMKYWKKETLELNGYN